MTFPNLRSGCDYYALWKHQRAFPREKGQLVIPEAFVAATSVAQFLTGPHTFTALCGQALQTPPAKANGIQNA